MITTIVGMLHDTVEYSFRDADCNRIRIYGNSLLEEYQEEHPDVDFDDCNAEELVNFIRWVDNRTR